MKDNPSRRSFLQHSKGLAAMSVGVLIFPRFDNTKPKTIGDHINLICPKQDYTPQIGSLVSMLDWLSNYVVKLTKKFSIEELDYLHDADSNTIGGLMLHIAMITN